MFAAISLAVTLNEPDPKRPRKHPRLKPDLLLLGAAATLCVIGVGALSAWASLYTGGQYRGHAAAVQAAALLVAVLAQPAIALLLTLSARRE